MTIDENSKSPNDGAFLTTRWTRVSMAKSDSEEGRKALADLCGAYYEPVVTFLRCKLRDADAARDMAHAFFTKMLAGGSITTADQNKGKFRSYLLGAVKHFLSHEREAADRQKRGGGVHITVVKDSMPDDELSPDAAFDREWAVTVLARALESLRLECDASDKSAFFEKTKPLLTGEGIHGEQESIAKECGMNLAAFRMALHRLKKRLRDGVKAEIAGTLDDPEMVKEEMQTLFSALGG